MPPMSRSPSPRGAAVPGRVARVRSAMTGAHDAPRPARPSGVRAPVLAEDSAEVPAGDLELPAPVLADQIGAEAVVRLLALQREPGPLVDAAGTGQHAVGPEHHLGVAGRPREPQALLDQLRAEAQAPGGRFDPQQPELGHRVGLTYAEDRAGPLTVDFGDPGRLARRITVVQVICDDPGHQRLVALVPAVLRVVAGHLALDDPAHVAGPGGAELIGPGRGRVAQDPGDLPYRGHQPLLVVVAQAGQQGADLTGGPRVQAPRPCPGGR